ncbi:MAG TPA: sugar phosphate isomerase/epimerase family protein [Lentisphaeria bacterium]|nr:sugar phosphate isomerase/epimerase family protein [Lentisphaeria bacterium]
MFSPAFGVSLHSLAKPMTDDMLAVLPGSGIGTAEIYTTPLLKGVERGHERLAEAMQQAGIRPMTIHADFGGNVDPSNPATATAALASLRQALADARFFRAPMVVIHASSEPISAEDRPARLECSLQTLAELSDEFRQADVKMAIELLPRTCLGNCLAELEFFVKHLGSDVCGVCLDVNHGMDQYALLPQWVKALDKNLITLHLSDYDGVDEKHWLPGKGIIDWQAFIAALRSIDYRGPFNFEVSVPGDTPRARLDALTSAMQWLSQWF